MDSQCVAKSLTVDLSTLEKELGELHQQASVTAAQKNVQAGTDEGGMVIRGK